VASPSREGAVEGGARDWGEVVSTLRPALVTAREKLGYMLETPSILCYSLFGRIPSGSTVKM
jgi:hypothetical protein